uniref:OTU domain-containing protein n=1 Tax=Panagrellus redivivus TaxID=6233 RepID=A0A7E4WEA0_PANRE
MNEPFSWNNPSVRSQFDMHRLAEMTWDDVVAMTKHLNKKFPDAKLSRGNVLDQIRKWIKKSPYKKRGKKKKLKKPVKEVVEKPKKMKKPCPAPPPPATVKIPVLPAAPCGPAPIRPPPAAGPAVPVFLTPRAQVFQGIPVYRPTNKFKLYSIVPPEKTPAEKAAEQAAREESRSPIVFSSTPSPIPCSSTDPQPLRHEIGVLVAGPTPSHRQPRPPRPKRPYKFRPFFFDPCDVNADKITDFRYALTNYLHANIVYYAEDKNTIKVFNSTGVNSTGATGFFCADCKTRATLRDGILWVRYHKNPCPGRNREIFKQIQIDRRELLAEKRAAGVQSAIDLPGFEVLTEEEFDIEMPDYPFCRDWYYRSPTIDELIERCNLLNLPFHMTMIKSDYQRLYLCKPSLIVHITTPDENQCGYRALSLLLSGTEENHEALKTGLLSYLTSLDWNNDFVAMYPNAIETAKQRLENPDQETDKKLTPEELTALAIMLHLHIFVFDADREVGDQWQLFNFNLDQPEKMWYTIETGILLYKKEGHYNAVLGLC